MMRRHEMRVPGAVPGAVLRLGAAAVVLGGVLLLNPYPMWRAIATVAVVVAVLLPRSLASWAGIACLALGVILVEPSPGRTAIAVLLIHLAHVLSAWAWAVPWRSRIRLVVLIPGIRRLLVIQAIAQSVALLVVLAVPPLHGPGFAWLAPLGAAVLTAASALALHLSWGRAPERLTSSGTPAGLDEPPVPGAPGANVGDRS